MKNGATYVSTKCSPVILYELKNLENDFLLLQFS